MELEKKTTILFRPDFHEFLTGLARQRGVSLGHLVRQACEIQYGFRSKESRLEAVGRLAQLSLPVGSPQQMADESVPHAEDLFPS